ncbi:MAG: radical SAM protein [Sedimentisphaerales bacterium]|nr:radical SAM protein [Sedimentisphaerales bacterium]
MAKTSYIFGPVPSRRLGRSLGVDLVPAKTCTYDCVYCQVGRTTEQTCERREWVPLEAVLEQLAEGISRRPDYITLSGSGEPTLYLRLAELIEAIKRLTDIPVAVITNGSLLDRPEVRRDLVRADLVLPTLSAGSQEIFERIHRPCPEISFADMLEGLVAFRREYAGPIWLEVFLLPGLNTDHLELQRIKDCLQRIRPDRVQLNTVSRPPAEKDTPAVPAAELERIAALLGPNVEIIATNPKGPPPTPADVREEDILTMLRRRPCSIEDIAQGLAIAPEQARRLVEDLFGRGLIRTEQVNLRWYFKA